MINRCRPPERAILAAVATAVGTGLSSVDRALRLLEELARSGPLGATELAHRTGCAKATAFRLARTLQARGFVVQNQDSSYRLGPRCLLLATGVHTNFDVRHEALPAMEALRDETGETVQLSVLEGPDIVYVEQIPSLQPVRSVGTMGLRAPAHCVSGGLSLLALLPFERVRELLPHPLPRPTAASIPSLERLEAELERVRARGFAINRGCFSHDVGGVGTSVLDAHGRAVAALNVCVPLYRLEELGIDRLGALVGRAAAEVSQGSSLAAGAGAVSA
jgi:DNA-binding IclR family transcriptional regulator